MGGAKHFDLSSVSDQVKALPVEMGKPIAAINGGPFFNLTNPPGGDPMGLQITRGELVSGPSAICFWIDALGHPRLGIIRSQFEVTWPDGTITPFKLNDSGDSNAVVLRTSVARPIPRTHDGVDIVLERDGDTEWLPLKAGRNYKARIRSLNTKGATEITDEVMVLSLPARVALRYQNVSAGNFLRVSTKTLPDVSGSLTAIGGGARLVDRGISLEFGGNQFRRPRSALGWNKEYLFMVAVDGRQKSSAGMSFPELAGYMVTLGCEEALSLGGDDTTTLWYQGGVTNTPLRGQESPVVNALVVVQKSSR